ncbi:YcdB/YcdC domain-containing protein [Paenibacillus filicis]|uniref:YcdB/YcdC domain-containing protein n=1 Tax=Paenibacillus filicis TaxID=669464 RepID=A0ABU9DQI6_9BACL
MRHFLQLFTRDHDHSALSAEEVHRRSQLRLRLREQAKSLFSVPGSYRLTVDEYEAAQEGRQATVSFVWTKPGRDEGITLKFDDEGRLLDYSRDIPEEDTTDGTHSASRTWPASSYTQEAEPEDAGPPHKRPAAEQFVRQHRPDVWGRFVFLGSKPTDDGQSLHYGQEAMGLPLPRSGFRVQVHQSGEICGFTYVGEQADPVCPARLGDPGQIRTLIADTLTMELKLSLVSSYYKAASYGLRLVYEPGPIRHSFPADLAELETEVDRLMSTLSASTEASEAQTEEIWTPVPLRPDTDEPLVYMNEKFIAWTGIDPSRYEKLREIDLDHELAVVWRRRDWSSTEADRQPEETDEAGELAAACSR